MTDRSLRSGALLALATGLISGVSVYVAKFGTQAVPDPFVYTTARNLVVGAALLALVVVGGGARAAVGLPRADWGRLGLIALVGGSVPFLLFFWGLTLTSAPTASFIQKTQFLWVAALAVPLLGEAFGAWQLLGLLALAAGTLVLAPVPVGRWGLGEALVLVATLLWSVEAVLARSTLRRVPALVGATARMGGGALVMLAFLVASDRLPTLLALGPTEWLWVIWPAVFLFGYVATWYGALARAPATVVTSVLTLGAPVTALIVAGAAGAAPPAQPLVSGGLLAVGAALLILAWWRSAVSRPRLTSSAWAA